MYDVNVKGNEITIKVVLTDMEGKLSTSGKCFVLENINESVKVNGQKIRIAGNFMRKNEVVTG